MTTIQIRQGSYQMRTTSNQIPRAAPDILDEEAMFPVEGAMQIFFMVKLLNMAKLINT